MKRSLSFLFLFLSCSGAFSQVILSAAGFGITSNSYENASLGVRDMIEAAKNVRNATIVLPGGRIDLWPEGAAKKELYISNCTEDDSLTRLKNTGFLLEGFRNLIIEGNNTLVVLHGKMVSFAVLNCENITIRNLRFDYERPGMSEIVIRSVSDTSIQTEVHPNSKYGIENGKFFFFGEGWKNRSYHTILFEPGTNCMKYSSFKPLLEGFAVQTSPLNVRFDGDFSKSGYRAGDILTTRDPYRDNCGGFISRSRDIRLENLKMYYMQGLGIVSQFSENITLLKVDAAPRESSGRIISSFADCFHFSGCRGRILIDSCKTSGSHDDPINIHGTHLKITGIGSDGKLTLRFMHPQTYGFEAFFAGDSIAIVNPQTLQTLAYAVLKSAILVNKREMLLELQGSLPLSVKTGDCIENITWTPGVVIRNCRFERTNTRGLLITTCRKVLIENNTFYRTGMHAILIADDASNWYESGPVQDVTICNNTFTECGYNSSPNNFAIAISPENHALVPGFCVHRNIMIRDNVFNLYDYPVLSARSVENLVFTGNTINRTAFMAKGETRPGFELTACKKVLIMGNRTPRDEQPFIHCSEMKKREVRTDWSVSGH